MLLHQHLRHGYLGEVLELLEEVYQQLLIIGIMHLSLEVANHELVLPSLLLQQELKFLVHHSHHLS